MEVQCISFWSCGCLPIFIKLKSFPISLLSFVYHTHCCICLGNLINLYPCLSDSNLMPILVKIRFILLCLYKEVQHQKTRRPQIPSTSQPNRKHPTIKLQPSNHITLQTKSMHQHLLFARKGS